MYVAENLDSNRLQLQNICVLFMMTKSRNKLEVSNNWQILLSKYVFSNKELQNNTVKTAGLGDRIQAKHTQKKTILI